MSTTRVKPQDFESFHTYLAESLRFSTGFIALASADVIVCACTVQDKKGLEGKIKKDVTKICTQGTKVDRIYFFSVTRIAPASRHKLVEEVRAEFEVELQILDGADISDMLSDYDVFWIAQTYLHLTESDGPLPPSNAPEVPAWYAAARSAWSDPSARIESLGDLLRVVSALRHATDHKAARVDLPTWLAVVDPSRLGGLGNSALQRARYDYSRAYLRGMNDLRPAQPHVKAYFGDATSMTNPDELYDAVVLLQYTQTAVRAGHADLDLAELSLWTEQLEVYFVALLAEPTRPARRCGLLRAAAALAMRMNYDALDPVEEGSDPSEPESADDWAPDSLKVQVTAAPSWIPIAELDKAMTYLQELVSLLSASPTFPIDSLTRTFDFYVAALVDHPLYGEVQRGLDEATTSRSGQAATATRCRDRAANLRKAGRPLAALNDLHRASNDWWQGDTLRGSLLTVGVIASTYAELGMFCAAKRHALFLAYAAMQSPDQHLKDLAPAGLFAAANFDYESGAWLSFLRQARIGTLLHGHYRADPWNLAAHSDFRSIANRAALVRLAADHRPELIDGIDATLDELDLDQYATDVRAMSPPQASWSEAAWCERSIQDHMPGPPFGDADTRRTVRFSALGLDFTVSCLNAPENVAAAELFCTAIQIVLVELAMKDPAFLPSHVTVVVEPLGPGHAAEDALVEVEDTDGWRWQARVPTDDAESTRVGTAVLLGQLCHILSSCSALPDDVFFGLIRELFESGPEKLSVCHQHFAVSRYFHEEGPLPWTVEGVQPFGDIAGFPFPQSDHLRSPSTPGPGYDHADSLRAIRARYENASRVVRLTLPRLLTDEVVRTMFSDLLDLGWKEWHLVSALANLVASHRMSLQVGVLGGPPGEEHKRRAVEEMQREEAPGDPSPSAQEVLERFAFHLDLHVATVAQTWGLQLKHQPVDLATLREVLVTRYGFFADDVEHPSLFRLA